jgi:hypothetical protein
MRSSALSLSILAALALAAPARAQNSPAECRTWHGDERAHVCEVRETRMPARGTLSVDAGPNGAVTVRSYEGSEVVVRARVEGVAASDQAARELVRGVRVNAEGTRVASTGPRAARDSWWSVSYEIMVPSRTSLDAQTSNGPISVDGLSGTLRLRATNGPLTLARVSGDVNARTTNGPVTVTLAGPRWTGGRLDVETTNGPMNVRIPRGFAAHVEASTTHGPLRVPAALRPARGDDDRRGWDSPRPINADLNGGGPTIRAVTTNGPLTITEI